MVANMAYPVQQPQHPSSREAPPDHHHQYAWQLKLADKESNPNGTSHGLILPTNESSSSWEARAFAEDASSLAAGIWPPRAYPCSFCRREFRSAQALGGHMNVHRRDRARLRQASPPPPFHHATHNLHLQPSTIIHKPQYDYSSTSLNPKIYPNKSYEKLPTSTLPFSPISPQSSSAAAKHPSDMATSFPLRLHLLASEAASALMVPQEETSDLLSLWPAGSVGDSGNGCHSTVTTGIKGGVIDMSSWSMSSSCSSSTSAVLSPSIMGATPYKCVPNIMQAEDESPKKKSNMLTNSDFQPYPILKLINSSIDDGISKAHDNHQNLGTRIADESVHIQCTKEARGEFVDLELRLGRRPS